MAGSIARGILKLLGWEVIDLPTDSPEKSVIVVAPHTSNYDFILGKLYYTAVGKKGGFLMKKEWFVFPFGPIFRAMGGIPVERSTKGSTVKQLKSFFEKHGERHIAITPEGTRSRAPRWKTGFHRIALEAEVPIEIAVIDYKNKRIGIFETFHPTQDMEKDIHYIFSKYDASQARYPDKFGNSPFEGK